MQVLICYRSSEPSDLSTAVMLSFDSYTGPTCTMHDDASIPTVPIRDSRMAVGIIVLD